MDGRRDKAIEEYMERHYKPEVIVIHSGGTVRFENGQFHSTGILENGREATDSEKTGSLGGIQRVHAAVELAKSFPDAKLLPAGRYYPTSLGQELPSGVEPFAETMKRELMARGVEEPRIITQTESNNTIEDLIFVLQLLAERGLSQALFISIEPHIQRIEAMYRNLPYATIEWIESQRPEIIRMQNSVSPRFIGAEQVLIRTNKNQATFLRAAMNTDLYRLRVTSEENGAKQVYDGTYRGLYLQK